MRTIIVLMIAVLSGYLYLNTGSKASRPYASPKSSPMIFIHGIKGGMLQNSKQEVQWLTGLQGIGMGTPNLKLPIHWNPQTMQQDRDQIQPSTPLNTVTLIPGIIQVGIYRGILREGPKVYPNFHPFGYDWRRNNLENLEHFLTKTRQLHATHKQAVNIVAHSMGGLITMAALQQAPELFDKVFFVGVPFDGGVGFLEDLHAGTSTGLNASILAPEVLATMPSTYSLFPLKAREELSDGQHPIPLDFYNPSDWQRLKLGPFAHEFSSTPEFKQHIQHSMKVAKIFRKQISNGKLLKDGQLLTQQPEIFVISGQDIPTKVQFIQNGPQSVKGWDFKNGKKAPGDGKVSYARSFPPKGLKYTHFESHVVHGYQLDNQAVIEWILSRK